MRVRVRERSRETVGRAWIPREELLPCVIETFEILYTFISFKVRTDIQNKRCEINKINLSVK